MASFFLDSFLVLIVALAGRLTDDQQRVIDFLMAEDQVLKEMLTERGGRLRFSDGQRRRARTTECIPSSRRTSSTFVNPVLLRSDWISSNV